MKNRRMIGGVVLAAVLLTALTAAAPALYGVFSALPARVAMFFGFQVVFAAVALAINRWVDGFGLKELGFYAGRIGAQILLGIALFAVLAAGFIGLPLLVGIDKHNLLPAKDSLLWFSLVYRIVFIGFAEEIVFRGYFMDRFSRVLGSGSRGVLASSLLFGLWHVINGSWLQVLVTAVIGLVLGFAKLKIKNCSTLSVALAHGLYDALLAGLSYMFY